MAKLSKVALTYLKYCSAIEEAKKQFEKEMREILKNQKVSIGSNTYDSSGYAYIFSNPYKLCIYSYTEKIEIGIYKEGKNNPFQTREIKILRSKTKVQEESVEQQWFGKECPISNFGADLDKFIEAFKSLIKIKK